MRKAHVALRQGTVSPVWSTAQTGAHRDSGIFAFERKATDETAVVVLNAGNVASESCADNGTCMKTSFTAGTQLVDVMPGTDGAMVTVKPDGSIAVTVPARSGRVLVRK